MDKEITNALKEIKKLRDENRKARLVYEHDVARRKLEAEKLFMINTTELGKVLYE